MKNFITLFFGLFFPVLLFGQALVNSYELEEKGYLRHPQMTSFGIVATNNYASEIYLIENGEKRSLIQSPGAGMYNSLSPDRSKIGFKSINHRGKQAPAIVDLATGEHHLLHEYVFLSGQPSFFEEGYAFTVGNTLRVYNEANGDVNEYDLGGYVNIAPVSPDGRYVVYNDLNDVLFVKDLESKAVTEISEPGYAAHGPLWSYDAKKIAYMTNGGELFVHSLAAGKNYSLGTGKKPSWYEDSERLVFTRPEIEGFQLKTLRVVQSRYDGSGQIDLTDPSISLANDASVSPEGEILYNDIRNGEMIRLERKDDGFSPVKKYRIEDSEEALFRPAPLPDKLKENDLMEVTTLITGVPFVNQVWDTPQFSGNNYNYAACAPATAIMAIGYFKKVPEWPSTVYQGITRNYANYVARRYTAYGYTFNSWARGVQGGMGYMWNSAHGSSGSPRTTMAGYIRRHDMQSTQTWSLSFSAMLSELQAGYPYPLCVMLTSSGHLILALGVDGTRRTVIVHDPYGNKNVSYPSYWGTNVKYDWPGYNHGNQNLSSVAWAVTARGAPAKGTLTGRIYEGNDPNDLSSRIQGAAVRLNTGATQTTNDVGAYSFELDPGTYTITASKSGYKEASLSRTVAGGETTWGSMQLQPEADPDKGILRGFIYYGPDHSTNRISGAAVRLNTGQQVTSASDGQYIFELEPDTYTITVTKSGYRTSTASREVVAGSTTWGSIRLIEGDDPDPDPDPDPDRITKLPYVVDFSTITTPELPAGWTGFGDIVTYDGSTALGGTNLEYPAGIADDPHRIAILPQIASEIDISGLELKFNAYATSIIGDERLEVGFISNPSDPASFSPIKSVPLPADQEITEPVVEFSSYNESYGRHIAIKAESPSNWNRFFIGYIELYDDTPVVSSEKEPVLPNQLELSQNYPNPFNPVTVFSYVLPKEIEVSLAVYDITGREIVRLVDAFQSPGKYEVSWDASGYSSGIYLYRLEAGEETLTRRMTLVK